MDRANPGFEGVKTGSWQIRMCSTKLAGLIVHPNRPPTRTGPPPEHMLIGGFCMRERVLVATVAIPQKLARTATALCSRNMERLR